MCFFNLKKAFEYPVLLNHLYQAGITECRVQLGGQQSESYNVERGVQQGSILSPVLFLMVMDPLLRQLEESGMGLSVNSYYAVGFLHADDIRTLASLVRHPWRSRWLWWRSLQLKIV